MVRISVRIWKPSTSASVQMMTLFQRSLGNIEARQLLGSLALDLYSAAQDLDQVRDNLGFKDAWP